MHFIENFRECVIHLRLCSWQVMKCVSSWNIYVPEKKTNTNDAKFAILISFLGSCSLKYSDQISWFYGHILIFVRGQQLEVFKIKGEKLLHAYMYIIIYICCSRERQPVRFTLWLILTIYAHRIYVPFQEGISHFI